MKRLRIAAAVVLLALGAAAIYGYGNVTSLEVQPVAGDVHVLLGFGGNVGVLKTRDGAVVVDTMTFRVQGQRIRETAERLAGPIQAVINTHYHFDHTHGNPGFAPGTRVVATRRTREHMDALDAEFWSGPAAETRPNDVFDDSHELRIGGKTIRAVHLGRGHTDGDLVVLFVEDRVLHTGDLVFHRRYPNIDLEAGGSVREWIDTLDRVMALDFDRVIPGHGELTDREGIRAYQDFLRQLWAVGETAAREGRSLAETLETPDLTADAGYEEIGVPLVFRLDREFVLRRVWEEATGAVAPPAAPAEGGGR